MAGMKFGLLRRFVTAGALAIGAVSAAMGWVLSDFLADRLLTRDGALSRDFVQSVVNTQNVADALQYADISRSPRFGEFCAQLAAMPDVLRANVYTPDRRVLWSSTPEIIGQQFARNPELDRALHNDVVVHVESEVAGTSKAKAEHMLMQSAALNYVENYVPVLDAAQRVIGVVELYRQPVALFSAIRSGQRLVWVGALLSGTFLFLCLAGFVRHTEQALHGQQRRLVEADALAMVGEVSAAIAHSIRNPLGSIRSTAELLREIEGDPHGSQAQIMRDVDRVERLIRTMLSYAGAAMAPNQTSVRINLHETLTTLTARLAPDLAAQGKRFRLDLRGDLGSAPIDPVLLTQALGSIITNACEATGERGCIRLSGRRRGKVAEITVRDNGVGIDARQLKQVWMPFHTTKPRGFGMGLTLVRRIVERAGGQIRMVSRPGAGTCVSLQLPVRDT